MPLSEAMPIEPLPGPKPLLKWAGGKSQLLSELVSRMPGQYNRYIEPFIGGGALFFHLQPAKSLIADSNPELINLYRSVALDVEGVIEELAKHRNSEEHFYEVRSLDWTEMSPSEAAARTIFLNRTCFNGLYRVNRSGQFNVPFGRYKSPKFLDEPALRSASQLLQNTDIRHGDYLDVLRSAAGPGDLVFLDPPYLPIGVYSDFKRYTKEQFYEEDHSALADEVMRLHELGAHVLVTNSNHPMVHDLFKGFKIDVIRTRRQINSDASKRVGEDVIVTVPAKRRFNLRLATEPINEQALRFPSTRYMGSKNKLLPEIWSVARQFEPNVVLDLFGGSGVVSYMFKSQGLRVISNDYMSMANTFAKATVENSSRVLDLDRAVKLVDTPWDNDGFVQRTFNGLYFSHEENALIDHLRSGIQTIRNPYERAIAMSALMRAAMKKRPRGIFTYVGQRYDDGRADLQKSFRQHFLEAVASINSAVFDNGQANRARLGDAMSVAPVDGSLAYIDPPYYSKLSDNEYVRRYHFVEGLARDWRGVEIQEDTLTKKFKNYPTPFSSRVGAIDAFDSLFRRHQRSILVVSYSSNSEPGIDEMVSLMSRYKRHVEVVPVDYRYSFGNQGHAKETARNRVQEFLFVGY